MNELKDHEKSILSDLEREVTSSISNLISEKIDETEDEPKIVLESNESTIVEDEKSNTIHENEKEKILMKHLLSVPAANSTEITTVKTSLTNEEMITRTEVTNEELKLRKIIYQTDSDEKKIESNINDSHVDEDDIDERQRLVIAISDDEGSEISTKAKKNIRSEGRKITSSLKLKETLQQDSQKTSPPLNYQINTSLVNAVNGSIDSVKIKILKPSFNGIIVPSTETDKNFNWPNQQYQTKSDISPENISVMNELSLIGNEIDRRIKKKTSSILDLVREYLNSKLERNEFIKQMHETASTTTSDLFSIAKRLQRKKKFERNPNLKEFLKIKKLRFTTSSDELIDYFKNVLSLMSSETFPSMITFYESVVIEMLNLNKSKMLQYLIDFMIIRKNDKLDLLDFNFNSSSEPAFIEENKVAATVYQQPKHSSRIAISERRSKPNDFSYNFTIRPDPIYQLSGNFQTNHLNVIKTRVVCRTQSQSFDKKPFDNNVLRGRRIARRLVDERTLAHQIHHKHVHQPSQMIQEVENIIVVPQIMTRQQSPTIVLDSDTPPPSLPSEPNSPPQHRIQKVQILSNDILQPAKSLSQSDMEKFNENEALNLESSKSHNSIDDELTHQLQTGQITLQELKTLSQNGTEIIPTNFVKPPLPADPQNNLDSKVIDNTSDLKKIYSENRDKSQSHEETTGFRMKRTPLRRKSCHERMFSNSIQQPQLQSIEENYMKYLHDFERIIDKSKPNEKLKNDYGIVYAKRPRLEEFERSVQMAQQQPMSQQQQHQYNVQRKLQPRQPLNYQFYREQFQREMRKRGYENLRINQDQTQPMEIVTNIPPEHYIHQQPQYPQYSNSTQKSILQKQRSQGMNSEARGNMMAIAYQQFQSMHRDSANLPPRQYAEQLKYFESFKNWQRKHSSDQSSRAQQAQQQQQQQQSYQKSQDVFNTLNNQYRIASKPIKETNYEFVLEPQSLQRKLKYKSRTDSEYVEPTEMSANIPNPPHSIYYSEPFAMARNKTSTASSPLSAKQTSLYPQENQQRSSRAVHHEQQQSQQIHRQQQLQQQQQPWLLPIAQRPTHYEQPSLRNVNGNSNIPLQATVSYDQPTEFLRTFYAAANQKNF